MITVLWNGRHQQRTFPHVLHNLSPVRPSGRALSRCVGALLGLSPLPNQCRLSEHFVLLP